MGWVGKECRKTKFIHIRRLNNQNVTQKPAKSVSKRHSVQIYYYTMDSDNG
jgi:hypothetical protein